MRDKKYYIALDDFGQRVVVNCLNEIRNNLIAKGTYTDAVEEVLHDHIEGSITDEDGDWFDYDLFLRPWGMFWEDVREADTSGMPYDDMMPLYYDDWYMPQFENAAG